MKRDAVALRAFTHADEPFESDQVILDMAANQFADWELAGLVRAAAAEEAAAARDGAADNKPADAPVEPPLDGAPIETGANGAADAGAPPAPTTTARRR